MFTGIITDLGKISEKTSQTLTISADQSFLSKLQKGLSVIVNGICLTIVSLNSQSFMVDFMPETAKLTNIKSLKPDDLVNLELPLTPASFLSGHLVQGHIDGTAKLIDIQQSANSHLLKFASALNLTKYLTKKGSVAINGISLTVVEVTKNQFSVGIIPATWEQTMLGVLKVGDLVNVEVDILAKYVEKLLK